jgi:hypothetical protein
MKLKVNLRNVHPWMIENMSSLKSEYKVLATSAGRSFTNYSLNLITFS